MNDKNFIGLNGFVWWMGVVEDRQDPLKLGRCKVRIFGWHSEDKVELPTNHLPWAQAMLPLNDTNPYSPKEADTIVGFFMDGQNAQIPVMMGVLPGIPLDPANPAKGFNDPRTSFVSQPKKYGQQETGYPRTLDEPTTTRLARGDSDFTPEQIQQLRTDKVAFEQPPSYNAKYPYNKVVETESGHALELDDTPNFERVHLYHKNGSNIEMRPDGNVQQKVMKDGTRNILGNDTKYVKGDSVYFIDGDLTYIVKGAVTFVAEKDITAISQKSISLTAKSSFNASATTFASVSGKVSSSLGGLSAYTSVGGIATVISGQATLSCSGATATYGGGTTVVNGGTINLVNVPSAAATASKTPTPDTTTIGGQASQGGVVGGMDGSSVVNNLDMKPSISSGSLYSGVDFTNYQSTTNYVSNFDNTIKAGGLVETNSFLKLGKDLGTSLSNDMVNAPKNLFNGVKDSFINFPETFKKQINYDSWISSGNKLLNSSEYSAILLEKGTKAAAINAFDNTVDFIGQTGKLVNNAYNIQNISLASSGWTQGLCSVRAAKKAAEDVRNYMIEEKQKFVNLIKNERDQYREKLENVSREWKDKIKKMEETSLQEWLDSKKYDSSCETCANEARSRIRAGAAESDVKAALIQCLRNEAQAYIDQFKTNLPITSKDLVKTEKDYCGDTQTTINTGG